MKRRNPIGNAIVSITPRDIVRCKRCNCPNLAWVKYKSGKSGLVETATQRPFWKGNGPCPEGLYALKFNYHKCEDYINLCKEIERRNSLCHPKAENPAEILSDAMRVLILECAQLKDFMLLSNEDHYIGQAFAILRDAQAKVPNLQGVQL